MNIISFLESILFGFLQGFSEFLPISSTGHLMLLEHFLEIKLPESYLFRVFLHLGTTGATIQWLFKDIANAIKQTSPKQFFSVWRNKHSNPSTCFVPLLSLSLITCMPIALFVKSTTPMLTSKTLGYLFCVNAFILMLSKKQWNSKFGLIVPALGIGIAQGLAVFPGISRSGITFVAGICSGWSKNIAARYSFLLSIPTILLANFYEFWNAEIIYSTFFPFFLGGFVCAWIVGFLCLRLFFSLASSNKLHWFAPYCFILGILILIS